MLPLDTSGINNGLATLSGSPQGLRAARIQELLGQAPCPPITQNDPPVHDSAQLLSAGGQAATWWRPQQLSLGWKEARGEQTKDAGTPPTQEWAGGLS